MTRTEKLARFLVHRRWAVVALTLLAVAAAAFGARNLYFEGSWRIYFRDEDPRRVAFDELQDVYTKNDNIFFVLRSEGGVRETAFLQAIKTLADEAWKLPYALRVDALTNFQHTRAEGDDLVVEDLVSDPAALDAADRERILEIALAEPRIRDRLLSRDGRTAGVAVTFEMPVENAASREAYVAAAAAARDLASRIRREHPEVRLALTGIVMQNRAFEEASQADSRTLLPLMYLALLAIAYLALRSLPATGAVFVAIAFSSLSAFGLWGWLGLPLNTAAAMAPAIILTIAVADAIHILVTALGEMAAGRTREEAIVESLRLNMGPVFLTSLTTAVGFLALNFAESPPVRDLGNLTALGVGTAWLLAVFFLPALMAVLPLRPARRRADGRGFEALGDWVLRRRRPLLLGVSVAALALVAFVPRLELDDQFVEYFDRSIPFRVDSDFAAEYLAGPYNLQLSVGSGQDGGITDPAYLERLEAFAGFLRGQDGVRSVDVFTDTMKRLNQNLHGDDPAWYRLPADREMAAQYLLLYEMSLPYGLDLNHQVDIAKSATRVGITLENLTSREQRELIAVAEGWLQHNTPPAMWARAVSPAAMFAFISEKNIESMIRGNAIALILISLTITVALRSVRLGALSLVVNTLPLAMTLGLWGLTIQRIGMASAVVTSMSLGIIVDSTVHLLSKYVRARRERGASPEDAVRYAFRTVAAPLAVTALMLVTGFGLMSTSAFLVNAHMGLLTAITIACALIADFFLLPPLLVTLPKLRSRQVAVGVASLCLLVALAGVAAAEDGEDLGRQIALDADRRDTGFGDSQAVVRMELQNRQGQTAVRSLRVKTLEVIDENAGDKSLVVFDEPRDVAGTALLTHAKVLDPNDQWIYLPSLRRTKRIASANQSGPFLGSEFAYEDLGAPHVDRFRYRYLRDEACGELVCRVVERVPLYRGSGYTKQILWIDKDELLNRKIEFYDRKEALLKTLTFADYRQYLGRFWRAHEMVMENHQTGKTTRLVWEEYRFQTGLSERELEESALRNVR